MSEIDYIPDYYANVNLSHGSSSQSNLPNDVGCIIIFIKMRSGDKTE